MGIESVVSLALDVACGTGQSTAALMAIADRIIGIDVSFNMLTSAIRNEQMRYVQGRAESLPLTNGAVSIMSTALAFHWFDRNQFLREAWRVLGAGGWLLVYTNGFTGKMKEDPAFQNWSREVYADRYPTPPRDSQPLTPEEAAGSGFEWITEDRYENEVDFTPDALVAYLITQTNVVAAVEERRESFESATKWLIEQVRPFFAVEKANFVFVTKAWFLRKVVLP